MRKLITVIAFLVAANSVWSHESPNILWIYSKGRTL